MDGRRPLTAAELFDAVGAGYEAAFTSPPMVARAVEELVRVLAPGARVLDVGSGTGRPVARDLVAAGMRVTGIDVSAVMVALARAQVPGATFEHVDVRDWTSPDAGWDAVCAFFPFLQMPRADTVTVLGRIARWLVPGGHLVLVTVPLDAERVPEDFLGHLVEITSFAPDDLVARVRAAGLTVVDSRVERFVPDGDAAPEDHLLVVARRPELSP